MMVEWKAGTYLIATERKKWREKAHESENYCAQCVNYLLFIILFIRGEYLWFFFKFLFFLFM